MVRAIFGTMVSQSYLPLGALFVQCGVSRFIIAARSVRSKCVLYFVVVSILVLYHLILCPVVLSGGQEQILCERSQ